MANNRIYYATQKVGMKPISTPAIPYNSLKGIQNVSMSTNFDLQQVFEQGQLAIYGNIEEIPEIEVNLTKVLDGCPLIYHRATEDAPDPTLIGRSKTSCFFGLGIYPDSVSLTSGLPSQFVQCSGMYVSSVSYTFGIDDNFSEDVTLVGNSKVWKDDSRVVNPGDQI